MTAFTPLSTAHTQSFECPKCEGNKILPEYRHVAGGVCFLCQGHGFVNLSTWTTKNVKYEAEYVHGWALVYPMEGGFTYEYTKTLTVWVIKGRDITVLKSVNILENRDEAADLWRWAKARGIEIKERKELTYNPHAK